MPRKSFIDSPMPFWVQDLRPFWVQGLMPLTNAFDQCLYKSYNILNKIQHEKLELFVSRMRPWSS